MSGEDGLPSDDAIFEFIDGCKAPPTVKDVARAFKLPQELRAPLRRRLRDLADRGAITRQGGRKLASPDQLPEVTVLIVRRVDRDGTLLAVPALEVDGAPPSIRVFPDKRGGRAPRVGQQVLARLRRISGARYEAKIIRILDNMQQRLFGIAIGGRGGLILQQAARGGRDTITLQTGGDFPFAEGDLVEAELLPRRGHLGKTARVIDNLGPADSPGAFSALAIAENDIPHVFDQQTIAETEGLNVPPAAGRSDMRSLPFVTIDGADARDFDDAVLATPLDGGDWEIRVAIADVSHYVRQGSALDAEARKRGNSVYLPGRVVPMLPEALSNNLCSLTPNEPRAAMVAIIKMDEDGNVTSHSFERALIRSAARLTYDKVQAWHEGDLTARKLELDEVILTNLFGAWDALSRARAAREPLALNLKERRVVLDEDGAPAAIVQRAQSESQRLIEDYMIAANVAAAQALIKTQRPCVFRVHDQPDPEKIEGLRDLADVVGTRLARGQVLRPYHFNAILAHVRDSADEKMVNEAVLRSQSKAVYSIDNLGHFGLALKHYAHFTSPIRRYADLLVHRALVDMLSPGSAPRDGLGGRQAFDLVDDCTHISETEGRAAAAERRTIDRFAATLFAGQQGKVVKGLVAGVTGAGAFVTLGDGAADGFLPVRTLPDDSYTLDNSGMRMVGRHNGIALGIGDAVDVLVVDVTPVNGGILLSYVDGGGTAKRGGRGKPRKAKGEASKAKRGAKAKARGKTGVRGGKKSGKTRRSC